MDTKLTYMHHHSHESVNPGSHNHTFGYLEHGRISQEVRSGIRVDKSYLVREVFPNGKEVSTHHTGADIKAHYGAIFASYLHAFVVNEEESGELVFAYTGPIPSRVHHILSSSMVH